MRNRQSPIKTLIFATVFFISGLMAYQYITKPLAKEAAETKEWPTVDGTIIRSELRKSRNSEGNNMYSADVSYKYQVNGFDFTETGISSVSSRTSMKSSVKKTLKKYAVGTKVKVFYDPEFPNTSVLETGTGFLLGLLLKLPLFFCVVSVLMVFGMLKRLFF
jgi:hypothetical protein